MNKHLNDKVIIITGASSGLGRELAIKLSRYPVKLLLHGRDAERLRQTVEQCHSSLSKIHVHVGDLKQSQHCATLINTAVEQFGKIDMLINNAGVSMWQNVETIDEQMINELMQINYFAPVHCTLNALAYLKKSQGQVVLISSIQGLIAVPNHSAYVASKHAATGFFNTLRLDVPEINVLQVFPGWMSGTHLRKNSLGSSHKKTAVVKPSPATSDAATVAKKIVAALGSSRQNLFIPAKLKWVSCLQALFPQLMYRILRHYVKKQ
ncbi:MAG: SDR family oxidoreductase [Pseudomonadota bacterium]